MTKFAPEPGSWADKNPYLAFAGFSFVMVVIWPFALIYGLWNAKVECFYCVARKMRRFVIPWHEYKELWQTLKTRSTKE